jgi:hypothetical protein
MRTFSRWMSASRAALSTKACILVSRMPDLCPFVRVQLKRPRLPA